MIESLKIEVQDLADEHCSCCGRDVEIPRNSPSKCPLCGEDILPCSVCPSDYNDCDWSGLKGCHVFRKMP